MDNLRLTSTYSKLEGHPPSHVKAASTGALIPNPKRTQLPPPAAQVADSAGEQLREEVQRLKWQNEVLKKKKMDGWMDGWMAD